MTYCKSRGHLHGRRHVHLIRDAILQLLPTGDPEILDVGKSSTDPMTVPRCHRKAIVQYPAPFWKQLSTMGQRLNEATGESLPLQEQSLLLT